MVEFALLHISACFSELQNEWFMLFSGYAPACVKNLFAASLISLKLDCQSESPHVSSVLMIGLSTVAEVTFA
jgi:hypothetical protein